MLAVVLLVDGHNDLPWALREHEVDFAQPQPHLHTDLPRLRAGRVGAPDDTGQTAPMTHTVVLEKHSFRESPRWRDGRIRVSDYILCTAPGFAEHERRDTREAALLSVRVDVPAA